MNNDRELLQQALDALQGNWRTDESDKAIEALRAALAQPEREWQGLTDKEYEAMAEQYVTNCYFDTLKYAQGIEAKLKEKNT